MRREDDLTHMILNASRVVRVGADRDDRQSLWRLAHNAGALDEEHALESVNTAMCS